MATKKRRAGDHAGVVIPPPIIFLVPLVAGFLLDRATPSPIAVREPRIVTLIGVAALLGGALLGATAVGTFKRRGTTVLPAWRPTRTVVTTGPYRFTRNPMYVGMAVGYVGCTALMNSMWPLAFFPFVLFAVDRYVIAREERYLREKFGEDYEAYTRRVRRWL
jgi:protein-S-isoprenylcysteine O-methyltransferase Ste14